MAACKNCGEHDPDLNAGTFCSKTCELEFNDQPAPLKGLFDAVQGTGEQKVFETGARREVAPSKGRFDLIPAYPMKRLAVHYANGAVKYADRNWEKGLPLHSFLDSAERHMNAFKDGDRSEDHLAAILWNVAGYIWTERGIEDGSLPESLDDVPWEPSTGKVL